MWLPTTGIKATSLLSELGLSSIIARAGGVTVTYWIGAPIPLHVEGPATSYPYCTDNNVYSETVWYEAQGDMVGVIIDYGNVERDQNNPWYRRGTGSSGVFAGFQWWAISPPRTNVVYGIKSAYVSEHWNGELNRDDLIDLLGLDNYDNAGNIWAGPMLVDGEYVPSGEWADFTLKVEAGNCLTVYEDMQVYPIYFDYEILPECDDFYIEGDQIYSDTVSAVITTGNTITLTSGEYYHLETWGGPWDDGESGDRFDGAISWDQIEWTPILNMTETCNIPTPPWASVYFQAITDTMFIRVNDTEDPPAHEFADNSGELGYTINESPCPTCMGQSGECSDYYELQYWFSGSVDGDLPIGDMIPPVGNFYPNEWYMIESVGDNFTYGGGAYSWNLGEISTDWATEPIPSWTPLDDFGSCVVHPNEDNQQVYWLDGFASEDGLYYGIRPYADGEPGAIVGDYEFNVYQATYTPPPSACDGNYELTWYSSGAIFADAENGYWLPYAEPNFPSLGIWAIETTLGPWYEDNGAVAEWKIQISDNNGIDWYELDDYPGAVCIGTAEHHYDRIYFEVDTNNYQDFRVRVDEADGSFDDNTGSIHYDLYKTNPSSYQSCADFALDELLIVGRQVDATLSNGDDLSPNEVLTPGEWYAVKTTGDNWNDGSGPNYDAAIGISQPIGPTLFYPLDEYPGAGCIETNGNYVTVYFKASQANYKYRAEDSTTYTDNAGYSSYNLYGANNINPPPGGCTDDYNILSPPILNMEIPAQLAGGVSFDLDVSDSEVIYLEVYNGPWYDIDGEEELASYDIEVKLDETWYEFSAYPFNACYEVGTGERPKGFINGPIDAIRVHNIYEGWAENTLSVNVRIYKTTYGDEVPPDDGILPPGGTGCYANCFRTSPPTYTDLSEIAQYLGGWLEWVGGLIDYFRCSFSRYIAWCPYHTDILLAIPTLYESREPFGTIVEFQDMYNVAVQEIDAYAWVDESGEGGGVPLTISSIQSGDYTAPELVSPQNFLFAPDEGGGIEGVESMDMPWESDSIWNGGNFELMPEVYVSYSSTCESALIDTVGPRLGPPMCFTFNVLNGLGIRTWFQWVFDITMIWLLLYYWANWAVRVLGAGGIMGPNA
jgi:hypothetical protein